MSKAGGKIRALHIIDYFWATYAKQLYDGYSVRLGGKACAKGAHQADYAHWEFGFRCGRRREEALTVQIIAQ